MSVVAEKAGGGLAISTRDQLGPDASREDSRQGNGAAIWGAVYHQSLVIGVARTFGFHVILLTCFMQRFDRRFQIHWPRGSVSSASCVG